MSSANARVQETLVASPTDWVANDFSIRVATVNGSGSQTANLVLLRSIFQTGVPVSGKNLFPSNIAGLPEDTASSEGGVFLEALAAEHEDQDARCGHIEPGREGETGKSSMEVKSAREGEV